MRFDTPQCNYQEQKITGSFKDELFGNLPVELFRTKRGYYVFDAHNVRMVTVDQVSYDILQILRERDAGVDEIVRLLDHHPAQQVREAFEELKAVQDESFLLRGSFSRTPRFADTDTRMKQRLTEEMAGLTISITGKCNLGCSYCVYGGKYDAQRKLSGTSMSWETLKNAMIFLADHSRRSKSIQVDFFGGEPLLEYRLIERAVVFLKSRIGTRQRKVDITVASNGTILNDQLLEFLVKHKVYLQFSIDGNREQHDRHRTFKANGRGSFEKIMKNLEKIYTFDPEYYHSYIRIKAVQTLDQDDSNDEFWQHPLIKPVVKNGHVSILQLRPNFDIEKDGDYFDKLQRLGERSLDLRNVETLEDIQKVLTQKEWMFFHSTIFRFFDVQAVYNLYMRDKADVPFTKGCLYGYKEGNVEPSGKITICHLATNWIIGDVNEGRWYFDKIRKYDQRIHRWSSCSGCFVQRFCDLCPEKIDGAEVSYTKSRSRFCQFQRKNYRTVFSYALGLCEANPGFWNEVDRLIEVGYRREETKTREAA
ncbi:MAG: radical SAM protein [Candidatus Aminicenantes bacterium]|nr:radical SAM protein [Candidatus Aminicenantes bacterium]NIM79871.1 radical SAM protein [Candidatus Aminicenantes bacterium]NIN19207.1 radical SAM protein [Candidatus Aminicenantes bacterium]NIN43112.1 radical SAM protein [Candidatus Aminicenantes bacterium]NIN85849.1 radical SAM protein [Candidatus Aminicenantes bacterium]